MPEEKDSFLPFIHTSQMPIFENGDNWILWNERLELHFEQLKITEEISKVSTLLRSLSSETYQVIHSICSPTAPNKKKYKDLTDLCKQQFTTPVIVYQERRKFHTAKMTPNENVSSWFARVKKLAIDCTFGDHLDKIVKDKFIMELPPKIFEKLCEEDESLTLISAYKKAMIRETKIGQSTTSIEEVNYVKPHGRSNNNNKSPRHNNNNRGNGKSNEKPHGSAGNPKCSHCGWKNHTSSNCKFKNSTCHSCGAVGHLKNICKKNSNVSCYILSNDLNDRDFSDTFLNSICSIEAEMNDIDSTVCNVSENSRQR